MYAEYSGYVTSSLAIYTCMYIHAAPGAVVSLVAEFNTSSGDFNTTSQMYTIILTVMFSPPTFPNGILNNYTITVEGQ